MTTTTPITRTLPLLQTLSIIITLAGGPHLPRATAQQPAPPATSTEWRLDEQSLAVTQALNEAHARLPFSREFEGVLDDRPFHITWRVGANLPVAWKGGVAGVIGNVIVLAGGLWMPSRQNLAYAYDIRTQTYTPIPPPPFETAYTQGTCDGKRLYVVGGRSAGRNVAALCRDEQGAWKWNPLPSLPDAEGAGRWLASVSLIPDQWLFLISGNPTGTPSEDRTRPQLPDYRLRLDQPDAKWQPIAPYPGGSRALIESAVARNRLYVFGGSHPDPIMRKIHKDIAARYKIDAPYNGVPNYRDAYRYDPAADRWEPIRRLPFPVAAGQAIALEDRYILLMGSPDVRSFRVGKAKGSSDPIWRGYGDRILCYDVEKDNYASLGVMAYGIATCPWVSDGKTLYGFGGEPAHGYVENTENVLQIGAITK